jgi:hypothetical protein
MYVILLRTQLIGKMQRIVRCKTNGVLLVWPVANPTNYIVTPGITYALFYSITDIVVYCCLFVTT